MANYCDSSALVKLVVREAESAALADWLSHEQEPPVSSDIARLEVMRAVRRYAPEFAGRAQHLLGSVTFVRVTQARLERAAILDPPELRSLDALHLATAVDLGDDLHGFVTYDERLVRAAQGAGIPTFSPR